MSGQGAQQPSRALRGRRLVNKSGLRLSYWVDGPAGRSEAFSVNSWEEGPLHVEPVEKTVVLSDTQLQAQSVAAGSCLLPHFSQLCGGLCLAVRAAVPHHSWCSRVHAGTLAG